MGRVTTNSITLSRAREASLGVLPGSPLWYQLEPNNPSKLGPTFGKVARSPISKRRSRRKGAVSDLDSGCEYESDFTLFEARLIAEEFCFARAIGGDVIVPTAVGSGSYTVAAVSSAVAGRLKYGASAAKTLFFARGFANDANNGVKVLGAAVAPGATAITVSGATAETLAANQFVELAVCGVRGATGDIEIDSDGNLISTVLDFTTLGLGKGQTLHVGGVDVLNQFAEADNLGFARAASIAQHKIVLEKKDQPFVEDDGAGVAIDILFGAFVRNVSVDHADYLEQSVQFELASPNLGDDGSIRYEYALGNYANMWTIKVPLTDKATQTCAYVGTNTTDPSASRATGAANAKSSIESAAFGTSSDIARLRVQDVDEEGLTTDFSDLTLTLKNNVEPEKVIGQLGARYLNAGNLEVDTDSSVLFTSDQVLVAIRNNKTCGLDFILVNDDGGVCFDLPTGTLGDGGREYPANKTVNLKAPFAAHQESELDFTLGISFFPVLP